MKIELEQLRARNTVLGIISIQFAERRFEYQNYLISSISASFVHETELGEFSFQVINDNFNGFIISFKFNNLLFNIK